MQEQAWAWVRMLVGVGAVDLLAGIQPSAAGVQPLQVEMWEQGHVQVQGRVQVHVPVRVLVQVRLGSLSSLADDGSYGHVMR